VAGAYVVFLAIVLIYVGIMAKRLASTQRELVKLKREVEAQERERETESEMETAA
jgi:hypothetical protein